MLYYNLVIIEVLFIIVYRNYNDVIFCCYGDYDDVIYFDFVFKDM